jgi:stage V sporulation protein SpoVS
MNDELDIKLSDEIKIGSKTPPERVGVHMFERMKDGGARELTVVTVGVVALQQAVHAVIYLNGKMASRGEQVLIYPAYEVIAGEHGTNRTLNRFRLIRKRVEFEDV